MSIQLQVSDDLIVTNKTQLRELLQEIQIEIIKKYDAESPAMTMKEASKYIGVSEPTIKEMLDKKEIPGVNVGRIYRFNRYELDKWLAGVYKKEE
ncbi:helix-turn-helix domain-containing protein [Carnobacterium sp. ISL-102]|uniref:helix-turn-helix domain-containing protein n=1 Tax=Carnobacterium sp. ISL-102 TaxID=2819142 RepID=UPI001BE859DA|nr:helix-turn-helix domain-containing protein [Carnobacterium sp. ISL-102]MBT2731648.1 helix-turn-helix domain-containing protein [Carnobacterium sp. ISL-102]